MKKNKNSFSHSSSEQGTYLKWGWPPIHLSHLVTAEWLLLPPVLAQYTGRCADAQMGQQTPLQLKQCRGLKWFCLRPMSWSKWDYFLSCLQYSRQILCCSQCMWMTLLICQALPLSLWLANGPGATPVPVSLHKSDGLELGCILSETVIKLPYAPRCLVPLIFCPSSACWVAYASFPPDSHCP